jgi:phosphohistidine phosphatase SixA
VAQFDGEWNMPNYVMLMRHGRWMIDASIPTRKTLTPDGRGQVEQVASKVQEYIDETRKLDHLAIELQCIWHATTSEARSTAELLAAGLNPNEIKLEPKNKLAPDHTSPYGPVSAIEPLIKEIIEHFRYRENKCDLLIVGHQPMLGWIAEALSGEAHPIAHAELLCLCFGDAPRKRRWWPWPDRRLVHRPAALRWVLTPADPTAKDDSLAELKEKIRGKMEGAKLLGTFIAAVLGFVLGTLVDETKLEALDSYHWAALYGSVLMLLAAMWLYFASYYAYDRLLMPIRFWSEGGSAGSTPNWLVMRPPSSAAWVLYQNMMRIWGNLFTPAMVLVFFGLVLLGLAVLRASLSAMVVCAILAPVLSYLLMKLYHVLGPKLGSED